MALLALYVAPSWAVDLTAARLWRAPDHTRIVFDLNNAVEHSVLRLKNPERLVIDIKATKLKTSLKTVDLKGSSIIRIRNGVHNKHDLRLVLDLNAQIKPRSFVLQANEQYGDRLVVDLFDKMPAKKQLKQIKNASAERRDVIIAIDAGHGGEDPGALGPNRIREKQVVFSIAKKLYAKLKKTPGYHPVLVRKGDYYVGLQERRRIAREQQADLFVSIHADAFKDKKVSGSSVYILSFEASSKTAKLLAKQQDITDLVGGINLQDHDPLLSDVLLDLSMTHKQDASLEVGHYVLRSMQGITKLHSSRVDKAAFAVLKTPDIPSILVETGFISNPREARKLNNAKHQGLLADAIFQGINTYFVAKPPDGSLLAWDSTKTSKEHVIARGDTLSEIALRYRVSVPSLRRKNGLNTNIIRVGQRIIIPAS